MSELTRTRSAVVESHSNRIDDVREAFAIEAFVTGAVMTIPTREIAMMVMMMAPRVPNRSGAKPPRHERRPVSAATLESFMRKAQTGEATMCVPLDDHPPRRSAPGPSERDGVLSGLARSAPDRNRGGGTMTISIPAIPHRLFGVMALGVLIRKLMDVQIPDA